MSAVVFVGDVAAPAAQRSTSAAQLVAAPQPPATKSADGTWLAAAILAATLVGVTGFTVGRYLGR
jgi:hypothetical protein